MSRERPISRRGVAVLVVVLLVVVVQAAVIAASGYASGDSDAALLRIQAVRAFYAAESGMAAAVGEARRERTPPTGPVAFTALATYEITTISNPIVDGPVVVDGRSGAGSRTLELTLRED